MTDHVSRFIDFMAKNGTAPANPSEIVANAGWKSFQIEGDRPGAKKGNYILDVDAECAIGTFTDWRKGEWVTYYSKKPRNLTPEQVENYNRRIEKMRAENEARLAEKRAKAKEEAQALYEGADIVFSHDYLDRKQITADDGLRQAGDALVIPMYIDGEIVNVQRIYPDGSKFFLAGQKKGAHYEIKGDDTIVLCEGYATGMSIHMATGHTVRVCFDAGNLPPNARKARLEYPANTIIVAADYDQWTTDAKGNPKNPGYEQGLAAAGLVDGFISYPVFPHDDELKRTDFNDLHVSEGLDAVKERLSAPAPASGEQEPAGDGAISSPLCSVSPVAGDLIPLADAPLPDTQVTNRQEGWKGLPFKPLGIHAYDIKKYCYYDFVAQDIVELTVPQHGNMRDLRALTDLNTWRNVIGPFSHDMSPQQVAEYWADKMIAAQKQIPRFDPAAVVRGVGAWMDAGRVVLHCGDELFCGDERMRPGDFKSKYIYVRRRKYMTPSKDPLTDDEAAKLLNLCKMLSWESPLSATFFSGWLVTSIVCGALPWRPHIWVIGEAGSGKSTIKNHILEPLIGDFGEYFAGAMTTEPGIRKTISNDGRPIILDDVDDSKHMENIIRLARISSSSDKTANADSISRIKSSFCFLSVLDNRLQVADASRITFLTLARDTSPTASENYARIKDAIAEICNAEYASRLHRRIINNLPALLDNINTFKSAVDEKLSSARDADQISAMIAGAMLLKTTRRISYDEAYEWVDIQIWESHAKSKDSNTGQHFLYHVVTSLIRVDHADVSVGKLIMIAGGYDEESHPSKAVATEVLDRYGIKVLHNGVGFVANKNFERLLYGTPFERASIASSLQKLGKDKIKERHSMRVLGAPSVKGTLVYWSNFMDEGTIQSEVGIPETEEIVW